MIRLNVLDQVPVFRDGTQENAVRDTVRLAQTVESLGYDRFWIAEHHGSAANACASPEILVAAVAAQTSHLRVGSGGVLLPHYSPLKVAENFRLLSALQPGRIDLGIGQGAGGSAAMAALLNRHGRDAEDFTEQVGQLLSFLGDSRATARLSVTPEVREPPEPWLLGSGENSARMAGMLGLPYCYAQFITAVPRPEVMDAYRESFRPSPWLDEPTAMIALRVLCARTADEAEFLARCFWMMCTTGWRAQVQPSDGYRGGAPCLEDARRYSLAPEDVAVREEKPLLQISGDPSAVGATVRHLARLYEADEVMLTTSCPDPQARYLSYHLLAGEFSLVPPAAVSGE